LVVRWRLVKPKVIRPQFPLNRAMAATLKLLAPPLNLERRMNFEPHALKKKEGQA
jgi:hypothetical protein